MLVGEEAVDMIIPVPMKVLGNGTVYIDKKFRDYLGLQEGDEVFLTIRKIKKKERNPENSGDSEREEEAE